MAGAELQDQLPLGVDPRRANAAIYRATSTSAVRGLRHPCRSCGRCPRERPRKTPKIGWGDSTAGKCLLRFDTIAVQERDKNCLEIALGILGYSSWHGMYPALTPSIPRAIR